MVLLAQLSDIHLAPLPPVNLAELLNKRITGYLNWKLNRARYMHRDTLTGLVSHLKGANPDFTIVSGDLVNLGLPQEFANAFDWLKKLGSPKTVCAVPGNHDAYVPGASSRFRKAIGPYGQGEILDDHPYPFVRRRGEIAVVGCSSAVATAPFMAHGVFDRRQAKRLAQCLRTLGKAGLFRVVTIHHPPNEEYARSWRKGLRGADRFRAVIRETGAELVLHGHTHRSAIHYIKGPKNDVPVIGVAAASADAGSGEEPARYNLFEINRNGKAWSCVLREYGYLRIGEEIVKRLEMRIC